MPNATRLILVDGSSYLFRAYHALPPLTNSKGLPTGAIYGVLNMIKKLVEAEKPDHIAIVFDSKEKTARHHLYELYKANRAEMPEELQVQIQPLFECIRAMGLPLLVMPGVEADDLIGTLAKEAEAKNVSTLISTGDKDFAQLVNNHITLTNTMTQKKMDRAGVAEKFGVTPEQIIDYLTLVGDSVDNVPGIPSVGPKTAAKWLTDYHTLDNLVKHAADIKGKVGENFRANLDKLPLSKTLVTIQTDIKIPMHWDELTPSPADPEKLQTLFRHLEFKSWLHGNDASASQGSVETLHATSHGSPRADGARHEKPKISAHYKTILSEADFHGLIDRLKKANSFALDTETTSLNTTQATLVGISFALEAGEAFYIPLSHRGLDVPEQLRTNTVLTALQPILNNTHQTWIGQNIKFDYKMMMHAGLTIQNQFEDTMLMSAVLNSSSNQHGLDALAKKYVGHDMVTYEMVTGSGKKQIGFDEVAIDVATQYAAEDADIALRLAQIFTTELANDATAQKVLNEIEYPLIPVLARMEMQGVLIDVKKLKEQSHYLGGKIHTLQEKIYAMAGQPFNIASPQQLGDIFYEKLNLPILKKTPKGQPSTAEEVLQELALEYPLPALILEFRSLSKLKSTYTDTLPEQVNPKTHRVHASFHQAGTSTGRLSCKDPNLQNIPIKTIEGKKIREAFIAPPGYKIVSADYSQIELRIMAHLSQDKTLLDAFKHNLDIHQATAAEILGVPLNEVTSEQRRRAKAVNFGLIYGMSAFGLAKQLKVERGEAQQYIDLYFARYPGVKTYMEKTRELAHQQGYVSTCFGRRLYLPDIQNKNAGLRKGAERAAINAPMQGTAAEMIKLAMIQIDHWIQKEHIDARLILQVHDELVFEVKTEQVESISEKIRTMMEHAFPLSVPLRVEIGVGDNWGDAH